MALTKDLRYPDMEIQTSGLTKFVPKNNLCSATKLQDFPPELIHHIQSLLPLPDAARTCILSRSWGHTWSTFPILRFFERFTSLKLEKQYYNQIDRTLLRYHQDNIPIRSFFLDYNLRNKELDFLAEKWIRLLVSPKNCLKELSLVISVYINDLFTLPDEILYGQHLHTLTVTHSCLYSNSSLWIRNSNDALIKCVSLRVLNLTNVSISEQVLNNLLFTCCLLKKIKLLCCRGFKTIKFKTPPRFLRELTIGSIGKEDVLLEIDDVIPCLELFRYTGSAFSSKRGRPLPFNLDAIGGCVKYLYLAEVFMDDSFFNTINSKFPFLENMTIVIDFPGEESFIITSASLKRLTVQLLAKRLMMDIQVYAPKLLTLDFKSWSRVPRANLSISYPITPPGQVTLTVK